MGYIERNLNSYEKVYQNGWGNRYPSSEVISLYFNHVKKKLKKRNDKLKVLDFGCSLGANTKFFEEQGFDVYGIDISETAIKKCVEINGFDAEKFKAVNVFEHNSIKEIFDIEFDLIVAFEVLYYFSAEDSKRLLNMFKGSLVEDGIIFASWITFNHDAYRKFADICKPDEQICIGETGSMDEELRVCVIRDKEEMRKKFSMFSEFCIKRTIIELEADNEILYYIGRKER